MNVIVMSATKDQLFALTKLVPTVADVSMGSRVMIQIPLHAKVI